MCRVHVPRWCDCELCGRCACPRRVLRRTARPQRQRREECQLPYLLGPLFVLLPELHHPCPCKTEVVLAGTAHDDVVQDAHADVLQGLHDLVGGVDVFFGWVALLSGVTPELPLAQLAGSILHA